MLCQALQSELNVMPLSLGNDANDEAFYSHCWWHNSWQTDRERERMDMIYFDLLKVAIQQSASYLQTEHVALRHFVSCRSLKDVILDCKQL